VEARNFELQGLLEATGRSFCGRVAAEFKKLWFIYKERGEEE
jgi:hypothetical protein